MRQSIFYKINLKPTSAIGCDVRGNVCIIFDFYLRIQTCYNLKNVFFYFIFFFNKFVLTSTTRYSSSKYTIQCETKNKTIAKKEILTNFVNKSYDIN